MVDLNPSELPARALLQLVAQESAA
jgi:hypothetical protein